MALTAKIEFTCSAAQKKKIKSAAKKAKAESMSAWIRDTLAAKLKR